MRHSGGLGVCGAMRLIPDTIERRVKGHLQRVRYGDKIERVTKAVGIKPCKGCRKRKKILNGE